MSAPGSAAEMARFRMEVAIGMLASIFSAVCIVLLNKTLFATYDFKYPVTLTGWHMVFTASTLLIASRMVGLFTVGLCVIRRSYDTPFSPSDRQKTTQESTRVKERIPPCLPQGSSSDSCRASRRSTTHTHTP